MDTTQATLIELLRQVNTLVTKEIECLNRRVAELEKVAARPFPVQVAATPAKVEKPQRSMPEERPTKREAGLWDEKRVAAFLCISLGTVRRWRLLRQGPKFLKIGAAVRYRPEDLEEWLNSRKQSET
jgi:predicted DNA-binding transcriptional regulator AlpA